jgi:hypothetical protein
MNVSKHKDVHVSFCLCLSSIPRDNCKGVKHHKTNIVLFLLPRIPQKKKNDLADTRGLKPIDMEVCYWALLFMPLVISHHLRNVFVQLANKRGFKQKKINLAPPLPPLLQSRPILLDRIKIKSRKTNTRPVDL